MALIGVVVGVGMYSGAGLDGRMDLRLTVWTSGGGCMGVGGGKMPLLTLAS